MDSSSSDQILWQAIEDALALYPLLRKVLPKTYPRGPKWKISDNQMTVYEQNRLKIVASHFSQQCNLPLFLWVSKKSPNAGARAFVNQVLSTFEEFLERFAKLHGSQAVLKPLWEDPWDLNDPKLWSVVAHCKLALLREADGATILRFGAPLGLSSKDADILYRSANDEFYLEIEMWHKAVVPRDLTDPQSQIRRRAEDKARTKFGDLPKGAKSVLAIVCMSQPKDFRSFAHAPESLQPFTLNTAPSRVVETHWITAIGSLTQIEGFGWVNSASPLSNLHPDY